MKIVPVILSLLAAAPCFAETAPASVEPLADAPATKPLAGSVIAADCTNALMLERMRTRVAEEWAAAGRPSFAFTFSSDEKAAQRVMDRIAKSNALEDSEAKAKKRIAEAERKAAEVKAEAEAVVAQARLTVASIIEDGKKLENQNKLASTLLRAKQRVMEETGKETQAMILRKAQLERQCSAIEARMAQKAEQAEVLRVLSAGMTSTAELSPFEPSKFRTEDGVEVGRTPAAKRVR